MRPLGSKLAPPLLECVRVPTRICVAERGGGPVRSATALPTAPLGASTLSPGPTGLRDGAMRPLFAQLLRAKVFSETGLSPRTGIR
jgi:hypothetical protein